MPGWRALSHIYSRGELVVYRIPSHTRHTSRLAPFQAHSFLDFVAYSGWFHPVPCVVDMRLFDGVNWPFLESLTACIELITVYMPHASLIAYVLSNLFFWGVTGSSHFVQFWQDGLEDSFTACHGHTSLCCLCSMMRKPTASAMLSTVTTVCISSACAIAGVSPVSRVCSDVFPVGLMTQEGAGTLAIAWTVYAIL